MIDFVVDKRTELLGVLLLISDYRLKYPRISEELDNKEYRDKIFQKFNQYKNEKVVVLLNKIISDFNFSYDAPVSLFLQLNEDYTFDKLDSYPFAVRLKNDPIIKEMLSKVPEFANKTGFEEFYESNEPYYNGIINQAMQDSNFESVLNFINTFYQMDFSNNLFVINLLPYTTYSNYGTNHNGVIYTNAGIKPGGCFFKKENQGRLVLHEFSHSVINPLTSKYSLYKLNHFMDIKEQMVKKHYWDRETIINEHVIRSLEIFFAKHVCKDLNFEEYLKTEEEMGFKYIRPCMKKLEEYYKNKDKYKDFEEFYPQMLTAFEKIPESKQEKE